MLYIDNMKIFYHIFLVLAVLSIILMTINSIYDYSINDWYVSGAYILMWIFLSFIQLVKFPQKKEL